MLALFWGSTTCLLGPQFDHGRDRQEPRYESSPAVCPLSGEDTPFSTCPHEGSRILQWWPQLFPMKEAGLPGPVLLEVKRWATPAWESTLTAAMHVGPAQS